MGAEEDEDEMTCSLEGLEAHEVDAAVEVLVRFGYCEFWWRVLRTLDLPSSCVEQTAAGRESCTELLEVLLAAGAPLEANGRSALASAMSDASGDSVELLLSVGADRTFRGSRFGETPMSEACRSSRDPIACLLIAGNSPDETVISYTDDPEDSGVPALLLACDSGNATVVELLLQAGASDAAAAQAFWSHVAYPELATLLAVVAPVDARLKVALPSRPQHCDSVADTLAFLNDPRSEVEPIGCQQAGLWDVFLLLSHQSELFRVVQLALMCGGDTRTTHRRPLCPLHMAHDVDMIELLLCAGANVDATDVTEMRDSVLSWACSTASGDVVKLLLCCGATPSDTSFARAVDRTGSCDVLPVILPFATTSQLEAAASTAINRRVFEALELVLAAPGFPFAFLSRFLTRLSRSVASRVWLSWGLVSSILDYSPKFTDQIRMPFLGLPITNTDTIIFDSQEPRE